MTKNNEESYRGEDPYRKKKPYFNIYKPLAKEGAGAALQFSYDAPKKAIFLEATKQNGARLPTGSKEQFDWSKRIAFKIGVTDIGKMLPLFAGSKIPVKLLHSTQDGLKIGVLEIIPGEYKGLPNYQLKLSKTDKSGDQPQNNWVSIYLSRDEAAVLAHFMRESLTRMLGFEFGAS